jgi:hypothetical protein
LIYGISAIIIPFREKRAKTTERRPPQQNASRVAHRPARQTTAQSATGQRKGRENAFT